MSSVFFYLIAISFVVGIFIRSLVVVSVWHISLVALVGAALLTITAQRRRKGCSSTLCIGVAFVFLSIGLLRVDIQSWSESPLMNSVETKVQLEGVVAREPELRQSSVHLYLDVEGEMLLVTTDLYQDISYGDRVTASGVLKEPEAFETDVGRTFNYPGYLRAQGIEYYIPFAKVVVTETGVGNAVFTRLFQGKQMFMDAIERVIPEPQVGLGEGLLLGVKRALGEDLEMTFRTTGIIHIVVLSGYNVMIVVEALMRLLTAFFMPRTRMVLGVIAIALFAILVGLSSTVVRASIMAGLVLIARTTGRIYAITRALMLAGIVMLLINPYLLVYDPGFQLSFLATLGLIFVAPHIEKILGLVPSKWQIREFVTATIATQIMVLPLLLYLIGEFSLVSVTVNVLVLPAVPFAMLLTFVTGLAGFVSGGVAAIFGFGAYIVLLYIVTIATAFGSLPFAAVSVPAFPFIFVLIGYAFITYLLWKYRVNGTPSILCKNQDDEIDLSDWTIVDITPKDPEEHKVFLR